VTLRTLFRLALVLTVIAFLVGVVQDRSSASLSPAADLEAPSTKLGQDPENNRLIVGLEAYRAGQLADAIDLLHEPVAAMDDWRLMILAESTSSLENFQDANTALESLTRRHPDSPIRGLAIQRAAQIAAEYEQWDLALQWIEFARSQTLAEEQSREIETLAWEIGITLERPEIQSQAGRRLLVEHPLDAVELDVEAFFRKASGSMDWASLFTPTELERRASRQVDGRKQKEALATLELIAPDQRSFDWSLLRAEALTRKYQGREALEVLESLNSSETERRVAIAWQRALAARDASRVRRGRNNLVRSQREEMKVLARDSLDEVARLTPEQSLKTRALKLQFALISDEEDSFEASMAVLRRLQTLDTEDTTGTRHLWRLGWQAYTKRDLPVAIGYWSELESMYPDTTSARSGRYWTGRSHEAMGHNDRALTIYGARQGRARHTRSLYPPKSPHRTLARGSSAGPRPMAQRARTRRIRAPRTRSSTIGSGSQSLLRREGQDSGPIGSATREHQQSGLCIPRSGQGPSRHRPEGCTRALLPSRLSSHHRAASRRAESLPASGLCHGSPGERLRFASP
jgi:TolA-binding protein